MIVAVDRRQRTNRVAEYSGQKIHKVAASSRQIIIISGVHSRQIFCRVAVDH